MTIIVRRHPSAAVAFGNYNGHAGVDREEAPWRVAFVGARRDLGIAPDAIGTVDGTFCRVLTIANSAVVKGMVILSVVPTP